MTPGDILIKEHTYYSNGTRSNIFLKLRKLPKRLTPYCTFQCKQSEDEIK